MAQLAADEAQRARGQRHQHVAAVGVRIVNIFVDDDVGVRRDAHRRLIGEQQLHGARRRGVDPLLVHDMGADDERRGGAAGRRRFRQRIDRRRGADLLRGGRYRGE